MAFRDLFLEQTTEVLRALAPAMAPWANLPANAFRERFFPTAFDPVDAWTIQQTMHDIAHADSHARLIAAGKALAVTV